ncbi:TetR/AcrR family transcriptional regulator C-terminal domain-containing protein [Arthrobacter sp.]|uniref:TetR/AcrR family transcriptional regulator n=1 Tax=Arthrobacter sp. TaxID=1667 RepID=UPI003391DBE9
MARPRVPLLSAEKIAKEALDQVDAHGDFSIPDIARSLRVSPSSIYHHLEGRAGILNGIRSLMNSRLVEEMAGGTASDPQSTTENDVPWQEEVRRWSASYTLALAKHPLALPLIIREPVTDEPTLQIYESLATTLARAGFREDQALVAVSMLENLSFGAAMDACSPPTPWKADHERHPKLHAAVASVQPSERQTRAFQYSLNALIRQLELLLTGTDGNPEAGPTPPR